MKQLITFILSILFSTLLFGQSEIIGKYQNHFGELIELKSDSTFHHKSSFDLSSSWTIGKWNFSNDTLYLKTELVMDTLSKITIENRIIKDSLVLSSDPKSNRIEINEYAINSISGGGQNRIKVPEKLFFKKEEIYLINENGELDKRKIEQFGTRKKYKTSFKKLK